MKDEKIKPTYDEVYSAYIIASQERYKYKNVIDKIKEILKERVGTEIHDMMYIIDVSDILELLEEVE